MEKLIKLDQGTKVFIVLVLLLTIALILLCISNERLKKRGATLGGVEIEQHINVVRTQSSQDLRLDHRTS